MPEPTDPAAVRDKALELLARREHSLDELRAKLSARGFDAAAIESTLAALADAGLQSDRRFVESYVARRRDAGIGPLKIRLELQQRGIDAGLIETWLEADHREWDESMARQRARRFGEALPDDYRERMKQARFLQNRGFSPARVMRLFR